MQPIHTSSQAQQLDSVAIGKYGIPGFELMHRAGYGAFKVFQRIWPKCDSVAILCGSGNNGGDGYVFAAFAFKAGLSVQVYRTGKPKSEESKRACEEYCSLGGAIDNASHDLPLNQFDAVVDALLGTGLTSDVSGKVCDIIYQVNDCGKSVLALDVPSGLDADTGCVRGCAVRANLTVTFISIKIGLLTGTGKDHCGSLKLNTLELTQPIYDEVPAAAYLVCKKELANHIRPRSADSHKGVSGRVLVIGGNRTMRGAALMAAQAAYRSGAGLVAIVSTNIRDDFPQSYPEIRIYDSELDSVSELISWAGAVAIGPGLGQDRWALGVWSQAIESNAQLVVDADALNLLANQFEKKDDWVLTPHPGEAGRLLGISTAAIQADRLSAAKQIVTRYGGVCILKGAGTVIASENEVWICDKGNPGMATGGMGDVLTGMVCTFLAQGLAPLVAARIAAWLHAVAGDCCAHKSGLVGMVATDLLPLIRKNLNQLVNDSS